MVINDDLEEAFRFLQLISAAVPHIEDKLLSLCKFINFHHHGDEINRDAVEGDARDPVGDGHGITGKQQAVSVKDSTHKIVKAKGHENDDSKREAKSVKDCGVAKCDKLKVSDTKTQAILKTVPTKKTAAPTAAPPAASAIKNNATNKSVVTKTSKKLKTFETTPAAVLKAAAAEKKGVKTVSSSTTTVAGKTGVASVKSAAKTKASLVSKTGVKTPGTVSVKKGVAKKPVPVKKPTASKPLAPGATKVAVASSSSLTAPGISKTRISPGSGQTTPVKERPKSATSEPALVTKNKREEKPDQKNKKESVKEINKPAIGHTIRSSSDSDASATSCPNKCLKLMTSSEPLQPKSLISLSNPSNLDETNKRDVKIESGLSNNNDKEKKTISGGGQEENEIKAVKKLFEDYTAKKQVGEAISSTEIGQRSGLTNTTPTCSPSVIMSPPKSPDSTYCNRQASTFSKRPALVCPAEPAGRTEISLPSVPSERPIPTSSPHPPPTCSTTWETPEKAPIVWKRSFLKSPSHAESVSSGSSLQRSPDRRSIITNSHYEISKKSVDADHLKADRTKTRSPIKPLLSLDDVKRRFDRDIPDRGARTRIDSQDSQGLLDWNEGSGSSRDADNRFRGRGSMDGRRRTFSGGRSFFGGRGGRDFAAAFSKGFDPRWDQPRDRRESGDGFSSRSRKRRQNQSRGAPAKARRIESDSSQDYSQRQWSTSSRGGTNVDGTTRWAREDSRERSWAKKREREEKKGSATENDRVARANREDDNRSRSTHGWMWNDNGNGSGDYVIPGNGGNQEYYANQYYDC